MRIAIADDYQRALDTLPCRELLAEHDVTVTHEILTDPQTLAARLGDPEALVLTRTRTRVTEELLGLLPALRLVSQTGKNAGHIDVAACTRRGVAVVEGRGDPTATAELTWALTMTALRELPRAMAGLRAGAWQTTLGRRVGGRRIGIWGFGKIGARVAGYARAFGAEAVVWGSEAGRDRARAAGYTTAANREELFATCDVVTLHLRLAPSTRGIVTAADLARMTPDALLVNTARAALIAPGALLGALRAGRPGYAALDVFDEEPMRDPAHPLLQLDNVTCTPHLGYAERDGLDLYYRIAFENVLAFARGEREHVVNPAALVPRA